MVDISIIIVSYNVRLFLEQTINAVLRSIDDLSLEFIVVDNNSTDNSVSYVRSNIDHQITIIENKENVGFAKANNQGIEVASGKYILLLNPDTVVQEDTLSHCFEFAESNEHVGAIGVRMVDGRGEYLRESKRAIPTPLNSFWKLSGVSKLFPRSKVFSAYNLGHVDEDACAEIDILCGAFMFMPAKVLKEVNMLDEDYFMYGEDIDLSYKIKSKGYQIWYLGTSSIIHYKGQSTQKSSLGYVNTFYNAMSIFAKKHYSSSRLLLFIISFAIVIRRLSSVLKRILKFVFPVLIDALVFILGFIMIKNVWAEYQFQDPDYYSSTPITLNIIIYVLIWISFIWIFRSYYHYGKLKIFYSAVIVGLFAILIAYGLLPETLRTSRAIILLGSVWVLISGSLIRLLYRQFSRNENINKRIGLVGHRNEVDRARSIVHNALGDKVFTQQLEPSKISIDYLKAQQEFFQLNEIIFCLKDISLDKVLAMMSQNIKGLNYKLIGDKSINIIGSNRSNLIGEVYGLDIEYRLADELNLYYKRVIDICFSVVLILLYPFLLISKKFRVNFSFSTLIKVLVGKMSLVGYNRSDDRLDALPTIRDGCIQINRSRSQVDLHPKNTSYALDYSPWRDIVILFNTIF